jgi:uncharacterized protein (TIGR02246 family)
MLAAPRLSAQAPSNNPNERAVLDTHERFQAAVLKNDVPVLSELLAPDYLFITATGDVFNRDDVIKIYSAKELVHSLYRADSTRVRMVGADGAVVTTILVKQGKFVAGPRKGTEISGRYRSTRVYVRRDGKWQVISTHESGPLK